MKNKKGQVISIVAFFVIVLSIFILALLLMSFVNTILNPVEVSLGNMSNASGTAVGNITDSFNRWWDVAIVLLFFLNVCLLMFSSYMVDTAPVFLVVYIISVMLLVIFGGNVVSALSGLWAEDGIFGSNSPQNVDAVSKIPLTAFLLNHFTLVMLGIIVVSGVVMYAKFKLGSGGGQY